MTHQLIRIPLIAPWLITSESRDLLMVLSNSKYQRSKRAGYTRVNNAFLSIDVSLIYARCYRWVKDAVILSRSSIDRNDAPFLSF